MEWHKKHKELHLLNTEDSFIGATLRPTTEVEDTPFISMLQCSKVNCNKFSFVEES